MNNIAIAQASNPILQQLAGLGMGKAAGSDVFAMLLAQINGMNPNGETPMLMEGMPQMAQGEQEEDYRSIMEMLAEMFAANPTLSDVLTQSGQQNLQQLSQLLGSGSSPQQLLEAMLQNTKQPAAEQEQKQPFVVTEHTDQVQKQAKEISVVPLESKQAETQTDLLGGQAQFRNSVMEAQKLLKTAKQAPNTEEHVIDIEKLQNEVNMAKFNNTTTVSGEVKQLPDAKSLMQQVTSGIANNLSKGKNEFVVKLKPEGLGEITVKLIESDSKISLSIITSTTQVAKLLSTEISALRESLRPLNADVHEVVTQAEQSFASSQHQQQFGQFLSNRQQQQFGNAAQHHTGYYAENDFTVELPQQPTHMKLASGLDTYI